MQSRNSATEQVVELTPDQIDRQPFRMRKRGYDISQVREFLRQVARQMRDAEAAVPDLGEVGAEAERIIEHAEQTARERSDEVLRETQERLDVLLAEEREVRARLAELRDEGDEGDGGEQTPAVEPPPVRPELSPGQKSLADFMKSAVRDEIA